MCRYSLSFLRYKEVNSRNCQKSINFRILWATVYRNPLADLNYFPSKRATVSPPSIELHLVTLRQKQKVAVLFTKVSTLTSKNVQPPAPGAPIGRSSPSYLVPVPGVCSTLSQNFTPIAPSCVEISSTVQTKQKKQKAKLISRQTLRCMVR